VLAEREAHEAGMRAKSVVKQRQHVLCEKGPAVAPGSAYNRGVNV
jgi:hypothetical protein